MAAEDSNERSETNEYRRIREDLEEGLSAQPTRDTDVMEFLAIAGLLRKRDWETLKHPAVAEIYERLERERQERRSTLTRNEKELETKMTYAIVGEYYSNLIKTVGDLRETVGKYGSSIPNLGPKGIAYFNRFLERYGLEQMTVPHHSAD